ncbi:MAG: PEP-CTERM sorting domain-containing protein [Planctomycetaceae bacterium]|nr:PEP-CTERM sorting domain-containing protein [Planctomycetaceae bacterium]
MNALFSRLELLAVHVLLIILLCGAWGTTALAQPTQYRPDQAIHTVFFDESGGVYADGIFSAVMRAVDYFNEVISTPAIIPWFDGSVTFRYRNTEYMGGAWGLGGPGYGITIADWTVWTDTHARNTQFVNDGLIESLLLHELWHVLGVGTSPQWGQHLRAPGGGPITEGMVIVYDPDNPFTFVGQNAKRVVGDFWHTGTEIGVILGDWAHHALPPSIDTFWGDGKWLGFAELDMAILKDLGHDIDIRNFFGRSLYQTHSGTVENNDGFNGTGTYGIGLHLVADGNTVVQNADLISNGYAGAGIRVIGNNSTVVINDGVIVAGNGEEGAGVFMFGTNQTLINSGTIEATGTNGVGVWFHADGRLNNYSSGSIDSVYFGRAVDVHNEGYIGNLTYNGGDLYNHNQITTATVNSGSLWNQDGGDIGNVTVNGWGFGNHGSITTATIHAGNSDNYNTIISATVNGGVLGNWNNGVIGNATVNGGDFYNRQNAHTESATVNGGRMHNWHDATVDSVSVHGGLLYNWDNAYIDTAYVSDGGWIGNVNAHYGEATIGHLTMNGGSVNNISRIDNLTYFSGLYDGRQAIEDWDRLHTGIGTIGTLTVAGNLTGDNWGTVNNLAFASNGTGYMSISGFADGTFGGINVTDTVNLANANLLLNLSGSVDDWFGTSFWNDIFSGALVTGWETASFMASWEDGLSTDWLGYGQTWKTWTSDSGYVVAFGAEGMSATAIPEPATLAIIGLGLAGLGWARRHRK